MTETPSQYMPEMDQDNERVQIQRDSHVNYGGELYSVSNVIGDKVSIYETGKDPNNLLVVSLKDIELIPKIEEQD